MVMCFKVLLFIIAVTERLCKRLAYVSVFIPSLQTMLLEFTFKLGDFRNANLNCRSKTPSEVFKLLFIDVSVPFAVR